MTVLERKVKFVTDILTDTDEERFAEMERFYKSLKKKRMSEPEPCMYTVEEVRESVKNRIHDLKAGKIKTIPHEQIQRKAIP